MRIFSIVLDFIFPPRPYQKIVRSTSSLPRANNTLGSCIYLSDFSNPIIKAAVVENKYHHNQEATFLLADLIQEWVERQTCEVILVPVPLGRERLKDRGYNQVTEVLSKVSGKKAYVRDDIVVRVKNTVPQTSLSRNERLKNVRDAFAYIENKNVEPIDEKLVVIVDDVVTTGATLNAVRATLAPHLPPNTKLLTLALAH